MLKVLVPVALILGSFGCAEAESEMELCDAAASHVASCFEQEVQTVDACDPAAAEQTLDQDCDQLQASAAASAGSADGFCNPFFWWMCSSSSSSSSSTRPTSNDYSFTLGINVCETSTCVEDLFGEVTWGGACGKITLEDENGDVVAVDYINARLPNGGIHGTGDGFRKLDLPAGEYQARLWRRDGEQARDLNGSPAELSIELLDDGKVKRERSNFKILKSEAEQIRACVDARGTIASQCGGSLQDAETTEWAWLIHIEGVNAEGSYENFNRSRYVYQLDANAFRFPLLRAGEYKVTFHEVDVWSSYARRQNLNADFEDYESLLRRYGTGLTFESEFTLTDEDIASAESLNVLDVDLESRLCR